MLMVGGCIPLPAGEETGQGQVQNRPDGVLIAQQQIDLVTRWRPPMDHGGTVQADRIAFRLWEARFEGETAMVRSHPVAFVWQRGTMGSGDGDALRDPAFVRVGGRYLPNSCSGATLSSFGATLSSVDANGTICLPADAAPQIRQIGGRVERVQLSGTRVTFADGLDGHVRPCTLDLRQIAPNAAQPFTDSIYAANSMGASRGTGPEDRVPAFRFAVSYLPPHTAYVIDHGQPDQPIYRATCGGFERVGQVLPLAEGVIRPGSEQNNMPVTVLDMVADPGRRQPALFLAVPDTDYGHGLAVIREGRAPQIVPGICHDCMPEVGGFFSSDPERLLLNAHLWQEGGATVLQLKLFDLAGNRRTTRTLRVAQPQARPQPVR